MAAFQILRRIKSNLRFFSLHANGQGFALGTERERKHDEMLRLKLILFHRGEF